MKASYLIKYISLYSTTTYTLEIHVARPCLICANTVIYYSAPLSVCDFKGAVPRDFRPTWISFPQAPDYTVVAVSIFVAKFAEIFAVQDATPVANRKVFIMSFGHLWVVELAYR